MGLPLRPRALVTLVSGIRLRSMETARKLALVENSKRPGHSAHGLSPTLLASRFFVSCFSGDAVVECNMNQLTRS